MAFIPPAIAAISAAASSAAATVGSAVAGTAASVGSAVGIGGAAAGTAGAASATTLVAGETAAVTDIGGTLAASAAPAVSTLTIPTVSGVLAGVGTAPGWLSTVGEAGVGLNLLGGAVGAAGAVKEGNAAAASAKYNAAVANQNASQAIQNANLTSASGSVSAMDQSLRTKAELGATVANEAASGLDVNTGSPQAVQQSERNIGELDALTIRSNATREAYGYQVESASQKSQAGLDTKEASNDLLSGYENAGSTLLGSAGTAATNFAKFQLQGGFSA